MNSAFDLVIGLEVHTQLATETKIFCGCAAKPKAGQSVSDLLPNSNTCPICTGHPGTLPVMNRTAVEYAVRAGLALGCSIELKSVFARKNYFYPDLPKGYQISQYDRPICGPGFLEIETSKGSKKITIQRIHLEEDAGKTVHHSGYSVVNLNRACVPLIEIVSAPDMNSPEEAGAYLRALHSIVTAIGVTDGNMQEGNFRCDANVSVKPKGSKELGTRTEIKNVNSFRFVEKAIEYEYHRQIEVIQSGKKVVQETRLYDADKNITQSLRSKEEAHDYRYFPDPDLISLQLDAKWVEQIKSTLPELPHQKRKRYVEEFGLSAYDAGVITASQSLSKIFGAALGLVSIRNLEVKEFAKGISNLLSGEVARLMNDENKDLSESKLNESHLVDLISLLKKNEISSSAAKTVLRSSWESGEEVNLLVEKLGLRQVSDLSALLPVIEKVLADNPAQLAELKSGKEKLMGFFVGQIMKLTGGKANPAMLQNLIKEKLKN